MIEEITWILDGRTPEHLVDVLIKVGNVVGWAPMPKGPEAPKRGNRRGKK